jgi:diphthamide biosynthesis methyltransferase
LGFFMLQEYKFGRTSFLNFSSYKFQEENLYLQSQNLKL